MPTALKFPTNVSFYLFLVDIAKKREAGGFDSVQGEYLAILSHLQSTAGETLAKLPDGHPWRFVFDLLREQSDVLVEALVWGPLEDHTQRLRHLACVYNALVEVRPWRPSRYRFLAWLSNPTGWENQIRWLVSQHPPTEPPLTDSVCATLADIERLFDIARDVKAVWGKSERTR